MLVVSDTSVLLNLAVVGEAEILRQIFGRVVAEAVRAEFQRLAVSEDRFRAAVWPEWMEVGRPAAIRAAILTSQRRIHSGERHAIALAIEIHADLLLIDETAGRAMEGIGPQRNWNCGNSPPRKSVWYHSLRDRHSRPLGRRSAFLAGPRILPMKCAASRVKTPIIPERTQWSMHPPHVNYNSNSNSSLLQ